MKHPYYKRCSVLLLVILISSCLWSLQLHAQSNKLASIQEIIASVDSFNSKLPAEELFLHLDKPYYTVGDTIWFKAYLLERNTHAFSQLSGLLYVEVIADSNRVVKQMSFPVTYGLSYGQIELNKEDIPEGNYTIRAYTNWMQNFGEDYFFHQSIVVTDALTKSWLVAENHKVTSAGDEDNLDLTLQLSGTDNHPASKEDVELKVMNGRKVLHKNDVQTNNAGLIKGAFTIPAKANEKNVSIIVQDKKNSAQRAIIPLPLNRPENIDLQFMPEGGNMVAGLSSKIAFKAIEEDGKGTDVAGKIVDRENHEVASFKSSYKGMGFFELKPNEGESYAAVVKLRNGTTKTYPLPAVSNNGLVLKIQNDQNDDSIRFTVSFTPGLVKYELYHIIGLARGVVCYAANFVSKIPVVHGSIAKTTFPTGIAHFTIMNAKGQPFNERITYVEHSDNLAIKFNPGENSYGTRDSVPLHLKITDRLGQPVVGTFSLSVTDNSMVKNNSNDAENIVSKMLLSSELKGTVETPGYYMNTSDPDVWGALDALLLTQGWIGYDWAKLSKIPEAKFAAEPTFRVTGKVTNILNRPVSNAPVILMSTGKNKMVRSTTTDRDGKFVFQGFYKTDSIGFFVQARNARGKSFGIGVDVDEFKPAAFNQQTTFISMPWYVNSDTVFKQYMSNNLRLAQLHTKREGNVLQDVTVRTRRVIKGSYNLNGPGEADQIIDENEIAKAGKVNLLQLLENKVNGFKEIYRGNGEEIYKIFSDNVSFVVDGVNLDRFGSVKSTLQYLDAADIKGVEVMKNMSRTASYRNAFLEGAEAISNNREHPFIEITTRSGNGIFYRKTPGVTYYKPIPVTIPRQFYSPKYTTKNSSAEPDLRSTIFWQPNLVTNSNGEATTSFYSADTPSTYTVIIQGSDMKGLIGYQTEKISIK